MNKKATGVPGPGTKQPENSKLSLYERVEDSYFHFYSNDFMSYRESNLEHLPVNTRFFFHNLLDGEAPIKIMNLIYPVVCHGQYTFIRIQSEYFAKNVVQV